jgi:exopolyphosphatase/guanosine-5'-triphosphate,3'-diphosphate pyrophosphatase
MRVGVVDIGSNTARLLIADVEGRVVTEVARERHYLRLADDVYARGRISARKLAETRDVARRFAHRARSTGVERLETIVTAPGRQAANGCELAEILALATGAPVGQLSGDDEGRLAWEGAVARLEEPLGVVGVVDVGGGSCELAVGPLDVGPSWIRSLDVGALNLSRHYLRGGRPSVRSVRVARQTLRQLLGDLDPPEQDVALVVGGTARAVGRVIGSSYGADQLEGLAETLVRVELHAIVASYGLTEKRAETLLAGTLILLELAHRLDSQFHVVRGGVREGAALRLGRSLRAAA